MTALKITIIVAGEIDQWLRTYTALIQDQSLIPSIHTGQLTIAITPALGKPSLPWAPSYASTYTQLKVKINLLKQLQGH